MAGSTVSSQRAAARSAGASRPTHRPHTTSWRTQSVMFAAGFAVAGLVAAAGSGVVAQQELGNTPQSGSGDTRSLASIRTTRGPYPVVIINLPPVPSEAGAPRVLTTLTLPGAAAEPVPPTPADDASPLPRPEPERLFQPRASQTINLGELPAIAPAGAETAAVNVDADHRFEGAAVVGLAAPGDSMFTSPEQGRGAVRQAGNATTTSRETSEAARTTVSTNAAPADPAARSGSGTGAGRDKATAPPPTSERSTSTRSAAQTRPDRPDPSKQTASESRQNTSAPAAKTSRRREPGTRSVYQDGMKVVEVASLSRPDPEHTPPPDAEMIVPSRSGPELYVVEQQGKFSGVWLHTPRTRDNWREPDACRYFISQSRRLGRYLDRLPQDCGADQVRRISVVQAARLGRNPDGTVRPR